MADKGSVANLPPDATKKLVFFLIKFLGARIGKAARRCSALQRLMVQGLWRNGVRSIFRIFAGYKGVCDLPSNLSIRVWADFLRNDSRFPPFPPAQKKSPSRQEPEGRFEITEKGMPDSIPSKRLTGESPSPVQSSEGDVDADSAMKNVGLSIAHPAGSGTVETVQHEAVRGADIPDVRGNGCGAV